MLTPTVDSAFVQDLIVAFSDQTWASFTTKFAMAIETYLTSATVVTVVTGVAVGSGGSYPVTGAGEGSVIPTGSALFSQTILSATAATDWVVFSDTVSNAIGLFINTSLIETEVSGGCVGAGAGTIVADPGLSAFSAQMGIQIKASANYNELAISIKNLVKTLLGTCVVTTSASGSSPDPWTGAGVGGLQ